ncbi:MAG: SAM-dependent methyltransferase, partial [Humibacillus sp.]
LRSPGGAALPADLRDLDDVLVVANEWLDVVPCTVVQVDADGSPRTVLVDTSTGDESLGAPAGDADRAWLERHWPHLAPGSRIEIGRARDDAWADLVSRVGSGTLVALDYGHVAAERPSGGTLTAYRRGEQTTPVPDATMDLTAHVAMDTLGADEVVRQREVLRRLGVHGRTPPHGLAATSPSDYLRALERSAAEAELIRPDGFGGFWWAVQRVGSHDVA